MRPLCGLDYAPPMWIDVLMVALMVAFFALAAAIVVWFDRI